MQAEEIALALPFGSLAAQQWNPAAAEKMLMIHGWLDNSESFHVLAPLLAQRFHVVAIDMTGHGKSFHRPGLYGYQNYDYQVDVRFAVKVLGWEQFRFACHSMGASIAAIYTALWPEQVTRIDLFDAYLPVTAEPQDVLGRYRHYIKQIERTWRKEPRCFSKLADAVQVRHDATPDLPRPSCERIVTRNLEKLPTGGFRWCFDEKLKLPSPLRLTMEHLKYFDEEISRPIHIYLGDESPYSSFHPLLKKIVTGREHFHVHHFACGHYPHVEKAAEISKMILGAE